MAGLRILLTNNTLAVRAGSELYVRDVALALQARGQEPIGYSIELGGVATNLRDAGIVVFFFDALFELGGWRPRQRR